MRTKDEILEDLKKVPDTAVDRILIEVLCDIRDVLESLFILQNGPVSK
jgi:hypothetical protein